MTGELDEMVVTAAAGWIVVFGRVDCCVVLCGRLRRWGGLLCLAGWIVVLCCMGGCRGREDAAAESGLWRQGEAVEEEAS